MSEIVSMRISTQNSMFRDRDRQINRQIDRQINRQTGKQKDRQKDRQREKKKKALHPLLLYCRDAPASTRWRVMT